MWLAPALNKYMPDFKALVFDLDGTAILPERDALPSNRVVRAVRKAKTILSVCVATGRSLPIARHILHALALDDPSVVSGGAQIINSNTEKTIWQKLLSERQVNKIQDVCVPYDYDVLFSDETKGTPARNKVIVGPERVVYVMATKKQDAVAIQNNLHRIDGIISYLAGSWTHNRYDIHITHRLATKKHALERLLNILHADRTSTIGIGDSDNDLPLFESVWYKVAMGNATSRIKKIADYITSSVDKDGLAEVIGRFIINRRLNATPE